MAINQRLDIHQSQSLVMTPQLQQAIKLLQFSNLELAAYVEAQLVENPLLERRDSDGQAQMMDAEAPAPDPSSVVQDTADVVCEDGSFDTPLANADGDFDNVWDTGEVGPMPIEPPSASLKGDTSLVREASGGEWGDDSRNWEAFIAAEDSLHDHLERQIVLEFANLHEQMVARALADQLDGAGYCRADFDEIAGETSTDRVAVASVHARMLQFDPPGIAARTLAECLAMQLQDRGELDDCMRAMLDHLDLIAKRNFERLAKVCGVEMPIVHEMLGALRRCSPHPAAIFDRPPAVTMVPDVVVRRADDGNWTVELNADALPRVLVNRDYYTTVQKHARTRADIEFSTSQWQSANWLVRVLDQRANTILKVASAIVQVQGGFLEHGVTRLRPLTLREIAEQIGMHESTVSRATSNKFIATPLGMFELKYFFSNAVGATTSGGDNHAAEAVRYRIRQLIDGEAPDAVLSDEALVEKLKADRIDVARRTVAKYRGAMHIPSSAKRRRMLRSAVA